jgi:hypothetical protein
MGLSTHVNKGLAAVVLAGSISTTIHAEVPLIEISALSSGRLYADYTIWDCCTLNSFNATTGNITVGTCATMGGYCSAGKRVASWVYAMPALPENATLISVTLDGRHSGGSTTFEFRGKWNADSGHGTGSAYQGYVSPDFTGTTGSTGGNFAANLPIELVNGEWTNEFLMVSAYRSTNLTFYNSDSLRPKLNIVIGLPPGACCTLTSGCVEVSQYICEEAGFVFLGEGTECESTSCEQCPADFNGTGAVDVNDLLALISVYGTEDTDHDLDEDQFISVNDLLILLSQYGECP